MFLDEGKAGAKAQKCQCSWSKNVKDWTWQRTGVEDVRLEDEGVGQVEEGLTSYCNGLGMPFDKMESFWMSLSQEPYLINDKPVLEQSLELEKILTNFTGTGVVVMTSPISEVRKLVLREE